MRSTPATIGSRPRLYRRFGAIVWVVGVVLLGELRAQGPQSAAAGDGSPFAAPVVSASGGEFDAGGLSRLAGDDVDARPSGQSPAGEAEDEGHVVPAIYARNPGVRFVYDRHVSKWM